jgi:hypothetical protein
VQRAIQATSLIIGFFFLGLGLISCFFDDDADHVAPKAQVLSPSEAHGFGELHDSTFGLTRGSIYWMTVETNKARHGTGEMYLVVYRTVGWDDPLVLTPGPNWPKTFQSDDVAAASIARYQRTKIRSVELWPSGVLLIAISIALSGISRLRVMRRMKLGLCRKCAYDLKNLESSICPECGTAIWGNSEGEFGERTL